MAGKRKIKLKVNNPFRLVGALLILILLVILLTKGIHAWVNYDPVQKTLEEQYEQDVTIIKDDSGIVASVESGTVNAGDTVTFEAVYYFKAGSNSNTQQYEVTDGLDIEVSDSALATVVDDNSVVFADTAPTDSTDTSVTVTVKYNKYSAEYTYTVQFPTE
jgi:hypothetical protein